MFEFWTKLDSFSWTVIIVAMAVMVYAFYKYLEGKDRFPDGMA